MLSRKPSLCACHEVVSSSQTECHSLLVPLTIYVTAAPECLQMHRLLCTQENKEVYELNSYLRHADALAVLSDDWLYYPHRSHMHRNILVFLLKKYCTLG